MTVFDSVSWTSGIWWVLLLLLFLFFFSFHSLMSPSPLLSPTNTTTIPLLPPLFKQLQRILLNCSWISSVNSAVQTRIWSSSVLTLLLSSPESWSWSPLLIWVLRFVSGFLPQKNRDISQSQTLFLFFSKAEKSESGSGFRFHHRDPGLRSNPDLLRSQQMV